MLRSRPWQRLRGRGLSRPLVALVLALVLLGAASALHPPLGPNLAAAHHREGEQFFAYVTNEHADVVSVIDTLTDTVVDTIPVGETPTAAVATPDGTKVYVANVQGSSISVIDTKSNTVVATITGLGIGPLGMAFTPDGRRAYVTNFGEPGGIAGTTVSVIDTEANAVVETIEGFGPNPTGVAVTPDGERAYVVNEQASTVSVVDTATNMIIDPPIPVGLIPIGVVITPDGTTAYVTNLLGFPPLPGGAVSVIDTATNTIIDPPIQVGEQPLGLAITPDGSRVYVINEGSTRVSPPIPPSISVIDTSMNTVIHTITEGLGRGPTGGAFTPDGAKLYVTNNNTGRIDPDIPDTVSVIDALTNTVIATITVVNEPAGVAIVRGHNKED